MKPLLACLHSGVAHAGNVCSKQPINGDFSGELVPSQQLDKTCFGPPPWVVLASGRFNRNLQFSGLGQWFCPPKFTPFRVFTYMSFPNDKIPGFRLRNLIGGVAGFPVFAHVGSVGRNKFTASSILHLNSGKIYRTLRGMPASVPAHSVVYTAHVTLEKQALLFLAAVVRSFATAAPFDEFSGDLMPVPGRGWRPKSEVHSNIIPEGGRVVAVENDDPYFGRNW
ncbi:hypothetical protein C8R43DRAFT_1104657 [Mycena crocata]|nr:hypothetical protein C8R43DRAFT_1104657 [Mycena crocata]